MKRFIAFLILFIAVMVPARWVQSEMIEYIVAEVSGKEIIKFSDLKMEEKFQEIGCLPPLFEGFRRNNLEGFIDEIILAGIGLQKIEKHISSVNRNFGLWVEKRDEWSRGEDVLQIWSGHVSEFFKKIILLEKIDEEDGKDLKKLIKDWKNILLVELFFPDESCFKRRSDVRKIIRKTADELNVSWSCVEERFLKRAFAKIALKELDGMIRKISVLPCEIKEYYAQYPLFSAEFQYIVVETKDKAVDILQKLNTSNLQIIDLGVGACKVEGLDLESLIPEFREGILNVLSKNLSTGYITTDIGYFVIQIKKTSWVEKQEKIAKIIEKEKREKLEKDFFDNLRTKAVIVYK